MEILVIRSQLQHLRRHMRALQFSLVGSALRRRVGLPVLLLWIAVLSSLFPAALSAADKVPLPPPLYAEVTTRVEPEYTPQARAAGLQGSVILYLIVSPEGELEQAEVIQSLGLGLDERAIEAVKQWRFKPATKNGKPVSVEQMAEVIFHLSALPSWEIRRSGFRVNRSTEQPERQLKKPLLTQYVTPAADACPADGGVVIVNLEVTPKGQPDHLKLVEGPGEAASAAALAAMRSWRFRPGFFNGKPRLASATVELQCRTAQTIAAGSAESGAAVAPQRVGSGTSAPVPLYHPEPEYSELARQAKYQGTVVFSLIVDTSGHAVHMSVLRPLGMGLDVQAMGAVSQWRFKPGMKDGKPVPVLATVEVNFRLL